MSSVFNSRHTAVGRPVGLRLNGESITHTPYGGSSVAVTAIVEWDDPDVITQHGREVKTAGTLHVSSDVTCLVTDAWTIGGVTYQTISVEPPSGGLQLVKIQANAVEFRNQGGEVW